MKRLLIVFAVLAVGIVAYLIFDQMQGSGDEDVLTIEEDVNAEEVYMGDFTKKEVCLAALASVLGWSPTPTGTIRPLGKYIETVNEEDYIFLSTSRKRQKCRVFKSGRVVWGAYPEGPWRTGSHDSIVTFQIGTDNTIRIEEAFSGSTPLVDTFDHKDLIENAR